MRYISTIERLRPVRLNTGVAAKTALAFAGACATGYFAQLRIVLPFTPVPVTGQTLAVLLCGALLGLRYGALSQVFYVGLGVMGMPWFADFTCGFKVATFGYLVGFAPAAMLVGAYVNANRSTGSWWKLTAVMAAGTALVFVFGAANLRYMLHLSFQKTMVCGVYPFLPGAVVKIAVAVCVVRSVAWHNKDNE